MRATEIMLTNVQPKRTVYIALILSACVASAGITVIYNLLPTLQRTFPDASDIGWVVTIYWLFSALAAALCGRLGDIYGRRRVLLMVLVLCSVGAMISANTSNLAVLIAGCAIQGSASAITPLSFGLLREAVPPEQVPSGVGLLTAVGVVAAGVIYVLSGVVIDNFSWQAGFWLKVFLAALAFASVWMFAPSSRAATVPRVNFWMGILFAPALAAILIGVQHLRSWGVADLRLWLLFSVGVALLFVWVQHQLRQQHPLIDVRMLLDKQIGLANACIVLLVLGAVQIGQILTLFFQQPVATGTGLGMNATQSGSMHLALDLVALVASPWSGRIALRHGARRAALVGFSILMLAWTMLALAHGDKWSTLAGATVAICGYAVTAAAIYNLIIESTPEHRTGEATGFTYVLFTAFFAVGSQIMFWILDPGRVAQAGTAATAYPSDAAFTLGFLYIAGTAIIGFLIAWRLPRRDTNR